MTNRRGVALLGSSQIQKPTRHPGLDPGGIAMSGESDTFDHGSQIIGIIGMVHR